MVIEECCEYDVYAPHDQAKDSVSLSFAQHKDTPAKI